MSDARAFDDAVAKMAGLVAPPAPTGSRRLWAKVLSVDAGPPPTVTVEFEPGGAPVGPLRYLNIAPPAVDDVVMCVNVDGDVVVYGKMASSLLSSFGLADTRGQITGLGLGSGAIVAGTYPQRMVWDYDVNLFGVRFQTAYAGAPSGGDAVLDLLLGNPGSSMWANPGDKPTILNGATAMAAEAAPDDTLIPAGTSLRVAVISAHGASDVSGSIRWAWA